MRMDAGRTDAVGGKTEADAAVAAARPQDAIERERWYRDLIDRDHELLLTLSRAMGGGVSRERPTLRLWRWMIDDLRSERRIQAELRDGRRREGLLPMLLPRLRPGWKRARSCLTALLQRAVQRKTERKKPVRKGTGQRRSKEMGGIKGRDKSEQPPSAH